jgi:tripeptidyl-peptidase-1
MPPPCLSACSALSTRQTFRIGLKQARGDELIRQLYAVSDPASAQYGRHLSAADVSALVAPAPATTSAVNAWLAHHNVSASAATPAGDWLALTLSVAQAERMLGARYAVYAHPGAADVVVRTLSYRLPRALHAHVDVVAPTTYFGTLRAMRTHSRPAVARPAEPLVTTPGADATVPSSCSSSITPACLKALYNITYTPVSTATNKLGVAGYLEEYANDADLKTFAKKYMSSGTAPTFQHVQVNGGLNDQSNPGGEANLDIQYTTCV